MSDSENIVYNRTREVTVSRDSGNNDHEVIKYGRGCKQRTKGKETKVCENNGVPRKASFAAENT